MTASNDRLGESAHTAAARTPSTAATACAVCMGRVFAAAFAAVGHAFERCHTCGLVRMADAPGPVGLADFYAADQASAAAAHQDHATNLPRFAVILAQIERHRRPGRFLDVGCSIGTSLLAARERGWQPIGLEPSVAAAAHARTAFGLDVRTGTLADAGIAAGSIDAVLMHHTLEHVAEPDRVLAQVLQVLAPGGVMYQSLPNHGSLKAKLLGRHFGYGITDEHLSHFAPATLQRLVRRVGFELLSTSTWSYRRDPRLLWDLCGRLGRQPWLERKCGLPPGQPMDVASYIAFLGRTKWAFFVCNKVWPARLCRWLGLGEDLHLIARRPAP